MKKIIFTTEYNFNEARDLYKECLKDEGYNEKELKEKLQDENEIWEYLQDELEYSFQDESRNLDVPIDNKIIAIGNLGTWQGTAHGYKYINTLPEILYSDSDSFELYYNTKSKQVEARTSHHDGTNLYTYRILDTYDDDIIDKLENAILNDTENKNYYIQKYTKSLGPVVKEIYGF